MHLLHYIIILLVLHMFKEELSFMNLILSVIIFYIQLQLQGVLNVIVTNENYIMIMMGVNIEQDCV